MGGLLGDLAWHVVKEGHNVKYCIIKTEEKDGRTINNSE